MVAVVAVRRSPRATFFNNCRTSCAYRVGPLCVTFRFAFNGPPTKLPAFAAHVYRRSDHLVPSRLCIPFAHIDGVPGRTLVFINIFYIIVLIRCASIGDILMIILLFLCVRHPLTY